jgi:hypothetical protein
MSAFYLAQLNQPFIWQLKKLKQPFMRHTILIFVRVGKRIATHTTVVVVVVVRASALHIKQ